MGSKSSIEWTDATWNPVRGCSRVSPGCLNCYAEKMATRFSDEGKPFHLFAARTPKPHWTGKVELVESALNLPLKWRTPKRIFVNSMSDLFHENLSDEAIDRVFAVMALCPQHTFQVLTKRPERQAKYISGRQHGRMCDVAQTIKGGNHGSAPFPLPNVWLGVSVENQETADARIPLLLKTTAAKRFVSYEPALGPVDFDSEHAGGLHALGCGDSDHGHNPGCKGIDWVIIGGESGPGARPFNIDWARQTIRQCKEAGVACFVKQLGARPYLGSLGSGRMPEMALKDRKGGDWSEWESHLWVREFPA